jgi:hypothetical protein
MRMSVSASASPIECKAHTLSYKPERELIRANDTRCAVVSSLVRHQLTWQDVEDRALVADDRGLASGGGGSIACRRQPKSNSWWVGAAEVSGEDRGVSLGQHGLDTCDVEKVLY